MDDVVAVRVDGESWATQGLPKEIADHRLLVVEIHVGGDVGISGVTP
jgi:membrane protein implicated in regulation of membrane protease activity